MCPESFLINDRLSSYISVLLSTIISRFCHQRKLRRCHAASVCRKYKVSLTVKTSSYWMLCSKVTTKSVSVCSLRSDKSNYVYSNLNNYFISLRAMLFPISLHLCTVEGKLSLFCRHAW